jgi:propanol-preferring alcohol dehydrogenase
MVLQKAGQPLVGRRMPERAAGPGEILARVAACAVCRTDLHVVDGELTQPKLPLIPGHEIVARVVACGPGVEGFAVGSRIGIPWLGWSCGVCPQCRTGRENLCPEARFTGYQIDGGYADHVVADARFCFALPDAYDDLHAAPLLCAGLIGWRSLVKAGEGKRLGIYGFGAAGHIVTQVARWQGRDVYAFTSEGDKAAQQFAREMGAVWAGPSTVAPPEPLDAAILFAPVGLLVPLALRAVRPGGRVVCGGIHMSDIPSFPYDILWGEREIVSVANLTRRDAEEFLRIAPQVPVRTEVERFALADANQALAALRSGKLRGAAVLVPPS